MSTQQVAPAKRLWPPLLLAMAVYEGGMQLPELRLRAEVFHEARAFADVRHKPLLNVGCPGPFRWHHGCGDVCVDLNAEKLAYCRSGHPYRGSVTNLPFRDGDFGAATCFHVLEHLRSIDDAKLAIGELQRVADRVYFLVPSRASIAAMLNRDHRLWIDLAPGGYWVQDRRSGNRQFLPLRDPQTGTPAQIAGSAFPGPAQVPG